MRDECVVLIPVYKKEMSELELLSFKQDLKVFDRPIVLYGSDNLDYSIYTDTARVNGREVGIQVFDKRYFGSVKDYNDLCLLRDFIWFLIDMSICFYISLMHTCLKTGWIII